MISEVARADANEGEAKSSYDAYFELLRRNDINCLLRERLDQGLIPESWKNIQTAEEEIQAAIDRGDLQRVLEILLYLERDMVELPTQDAVDLMYYKHLAAYYDCERHRLVGPADDPDHFQYNDKQYQLFSQAAQKLGKEEGER